MLAGTAIFAFVLYPSKPDTSPVTWAHQKAKQELKEEGFQL